MSEGGLLMRSRAFQRLLLAATVVTGAPVAAQEEVGTSAVPDYACKPVPGLELSRWAIDDEDSGGPELLTVYSANCGVARPIDSEIFVTVSVRQANGSFYARGSFPGRRTRDPQWFVIQAYSDGGYLEHLWIRNAGQGALQAHIEYESLDSKPSASADYWYHHPSTVPVGPVLKPSSSSTLPALPQPGGSSAVTAQTKGVMYAVAGNGDLKWYLHAGRRDGSFLWSPDSGNVVGIGWGDFKQLFSAADGVIYGIASNGDLKWYRHVGRDEGTFDWSPGSGNVVGTGWGAFEQLFSGGDGVIYGLASNGDLIWYRHAGRTDGSFNWSPGSGNVVGTGWGDFKQLLSGGDGVLYAVASNGDLKWYRHDGRLDGSFTWSDLSGAVVGTGWGDFKQVFSGGDGVLYGLASNGDLKWYLYEGRADGSFTWGTGSGNVVGTGWENLRLDESKVVHATVPAQDAPPPP